MYDHTSGCGYDTSTGKWLALVLCLFIAISSCKVQYNKETALINNDIYTIVANDELQSLAYFNADYVETALENVPFKKIPLKKKDIKEVFYSVGTNTPEYYGILVFQSKNYLNTTEWNGNDDIVIEKMNVTSIDNVYQLSYKYDLDTPLGYLNENLKRELDSFKVIDKSCRTYQDIITKYGTIEDVYAALGFYYLLKGSVHKLEFCTENDRVFAESVINNYLAISGVSPVLKFKYDRESLLKQLSGYDIILIKDNHQGYVEELFIKGLLPCLDIDQIFFEALTSDRDYSRFDGAQVSDGFYLFQEPYNGLVNATINFDIIVSAFDHNDVSCGMDITCNQEREMVQRDNILQQLNSVTSAMVMSGGSHSQLVCTDSYQYLGCLLCNEEPELKIAQLNISEDVIVINDCDSNTLKIPMEIDTINLPINYTRRFDSPTIVSIHKKEQYEKLKNQDVPEYLFIVDDELSVHLSQGEYIECSYDLLGKILNEKSLKISN